MHLTIEDLLTLIVNFKNAIKSYNKAMKLDSTCSHAFYNRGVSYYFLKQYQQSVDDLNAALKCQKPGKLVPKGNYDAYLTGLRSVVNLILGHLDQSTRILNAHQNRR